MSAPDIDQIENFLMRLNNAAGCCNQLAENQGRSREGDALYFLHSGLEQLADEVRGWRDTVIGANKTKGNGPRAVS